MKGDERVTDEATGLPPIETIDPLNCIVVAAWQASEGIVHNPATGVDIPVRYLSVRGLYNETGNSMYWGQIHIAVPVEHAVDVAADLAKGTTESL